MLERGRGHCGSSLDPLILQMMIMMPWITAYATRCCVLVSACMIPQDSSAYIAAAVGTRSSTTVTIYKWQMSYEIAKVQVDAAIMKYAVLKIVSPGPASSCHNLSPMF